MSTQLGVALHSLDQSVLVQSSALPRERRHKQANRGNGCRPTEGKLGQGTGAVEYAQFWRCNRDCASRSSVMTRVITGKRYAAMKFSSGVLSNLRPVWYRNYRMLLVKSRAADVPPADRYLRSALDPFWGCIRSIASPNSEKVIIDTDIGDDVDDAFAVV